MHAHVRTSTRRLLAACAVCALATALPAVAQAASTPYGELTRFGEGGSGPEQLSRGHKRGVWDLRSLLIGVSPKESSGGKENVAYVLDEPRENEQKLAHPPTKEELEECEAEEAPIPANECGPRVGPITRFFRLRKFAPAGGSYKRVATLEFEEKQIPDAPEEATGLTVEGIATDPARNRLYVLAVDNRPKGIKVDESGQKGPDLQVAARIFAFEDKGGSLVAVTKKGKEYLTGPTELGAVSTVPGVALLEPTGITVDPASGEVIVMGHNDPEGLKEDQPYERSGAKADHFVLQRINATTGELVTGEAGRYLDGEDFFKTKEGEFEGHATSPNSPVVAGPAGGEHVHVAFEGGIARLPDPWVAASKPEYLYNPNVLLPGATSGAIPREAAANRGGALSASPFEAGDNTLYAPTSLTYEQQASTEEVTNVMSLSGATDSLLGWSGGQSLHAPRSGGEVPEECVLDPGGASLFNPVAAGAGGTVFVLATEYLAEPGGEPLVEQNYPAIIEFGPGGGGCPPANANGLTAEVGGILVGEGEVKQSEQVTFSSYINQADALKVEWNFGDGSSETVTGGFHCPANAPSETKALVRQCPSVRHTFRESGELTVTEKVYTDDLDTPTLTQQKKIKVSGGGKGKGGGSEPTAVPLGPEHLYSGEAGVFDGSESFDPSGSQIKHYLWTFGDGTQEPSETPVTTHAYAHQGLYEASLVVTDALGLSSPPSGLPTAVRVLPPPPPPPPASNALPPAPGGSVGGFTSTQSAAIPNVRLTEAALVMNARGAVTLRLYCPVGETTCAGRVTLKALLASGTRHGRSKRVSATFASGAFALAGGTARTFPLRVSATARATLAQRHRLVAQLTIDAHDTAGATHTTSVPVVVTAARNARGRRKH
jgi:hypothetical protein